MSIDPTLIAKLNPAELEALAAYLAPQIAAINTQEHDLSDPADWMERNFWIPDLQTPDNPLPRKGLIVLMPCIKTLLRYIFDPNRPLSDYFQLIVWSTIKKSSKTSISAAVGRWIAEKKGPYSDVVFVANDREQAKGRAYEYATRSLALDPRWDPRREEIMPVGVVKGPSGSSPKLALPEWYTSQQGAFFLDGGKLRAIAKDYKGEAGANQNAAIFTEIAFMTEDRARRLWDEMRPPPTRWAIRMAEGYAGFLGEGKLWQELWEMFHDIDDPHKLPQDSRRVSREELEPYGGWVDWDGAPFRNPDGSLEDPPLWVNERARAVGYIDQGVMARRMPWQQGALGRSYYAAQESSERYEAVRRLDYNEWVSPVSEFIPMEWWDACELRSETEYAHPAHMKSLRQRQVSSQVAARLRGDDPSAVRWVIDEDGRPLIPPLDAHTPIIIGVDASVTGDCTAMVGVARAPWAPHTEVIIHFAHIWTPPQTKDRSGRKIGLDYHTTIEQELRRACSRYNVIQVCYDPYQMHQLMTDLMRGRVTRDRGEWGNPDPQSGALAIAEAADLEVWCYPFSQAGDRNKADKQLYDLIRERRIWHPRMPELTGHIRNAAAKTSKDEDTKLRIVKKPGGSDAPKIDGAVALAMAAFSCLNLNIS